MGWFWAKNDPKSPLYDEQKELRDFVKKKKKRKEINDEINNDGNNDEINEIKWFFFQKFFFFFLS
jgi:hypothetical protein